MTSSSGLFNGKFSRATLGAWLKGAGAIGLGLIPCPDCGVPLAIKYWPAALVLGLVGLLRLRHKRSLSESGFQQEHGGEQLD